MNTIGRPGSAIRIMRSREHDTRGNDTKNVSSIETQVNLF